MACDQILDLYADTVEKFNAIKRHSEAHRNRIMGAADAKNAKPHYRLPVGERSLLEALGARRGKHMLSPDPNNL
jgi:hypothetical protein